MYRLLLIFALSAAALCANPVTESAWEKNRSFYDYLRLNSINTAIITEQDDDTADALRTILAGSSFFEHRDEESGRLLHALIPIGEERQISLYEENGAYKIELIRIRYSTVIESIAVDIRSSLQNDLQKVMGNSRLAQELVSIYDDRVDFRRDIRLGDQVSALYIRKVRLGKTHGTVTALSSFIETAKRRHYAFYNSDDEGYYDENGKSLAGLFLKYPLNFRKITSTYQPSGRAHPVLGITRPHLGVDFAAAKGTHVASVADGVIRFAGCQRSCESGYGKLVIIEHKNGWESRYAHLSGFNRVSPGMRVRQGQTVAFVGSTGVTTGTHLHFEVRKNGDTTNPLAIKNIRKDALRGEALTRFAEEAKRQKVSLDYYADTAKEGVTRLSQSSK
ncbi:membrane protein [Campylobacterota bacterium]|nr:membrane protein [Campylobacterota bacterium]